MSLIVHNTILSVVYRYRIQEQCFLFYFKIIGIRYFPIRRILIHNTIMSGPR